MSGDTREKTFVNWWRKRVTRRFVFFLPFFLIPHRYQDFRPHFCSLQTRLVREIYIYICIQELENNVEAKIPYPVIIIADSLERGFFENDACRAPPRVNFHLNFIPNPETALLL